MASSSTPLVSCTFHSTKKKESRANSVYSPYAKDSPMLASGGNVVVIRKLVTHWAAAATDSAAPRMRFGNISPSSTQTTGPQVAPNETTNRFAPTRATWPQPCDSCGVCLPSGPVTSVAWVNAMAIAPSETNIPADPQSSSSRRPILSTSRMATTVTAMLVTEVATEMMKDADSLKPTDCHSVVE